MHAITKNHQDALLAAENAAKDWAASGLAREAQLLRWTIEQNEAEDGEARWSGPDLGSIHYAKQALLELKEFKATEISASGNGEINLAFEPRKDIQAAITPHADGTAFRFLYIEKHGEGPDYIQFEDEPFDLAIQNLMESIRKAA